MFKATIGVFYRGGAENLNNVLWHALSHREHIVVYPKV